MHMYVYIHLHEYTSHKIITLRHSQDNWSLNVFTKVSVFVEMWWRALLKSARGVSLVNVPGASLQCRLLLGRRRRSQPRKRQRPAWLRPRVAPHSSTTPCHTWRSPARCRCNVSICACHIRVDDAACLKFMQARTQARIHTRTHRYQYIYTCWHVSICECICTYTFMYVCVCLCVLVYTGSRAWCPPLSQSLGCWGRQCRGQDVVRGVWGSMGGYIGCGRACVCACLSAHRYVWDGSQSRVECVCWHIIYEWPSLLLATHAVFCNLLFPCGTFEMSAVLMQAPKASREFFHRLNSQKSTRY